MHVRAATRTSEEYLSRQAKFESNARTYPRKLPLAIKRAHGIHLVDVNGTSYLDCLAGAGTLALGHNHPVVVAAVQRHLAEGAPLHTLDFTTPAKDEFVEALFATLPEPLRSRGRIQFCGPSGSDAIEAALKLTKIATGRRSILAFSGGYHGQTHGSLAMMGNLGPKANLPGLMADVHFLPFPHGTRCPLGCDRCDGEHSAGYVERLLRDPESGIAPPAAMVMEVVQGEGGSIPAPDNWLRRMRRLTEELGIPLVIDEVQTGWGRTGTLYAFERAGVVPDVLVLSKAIGGSLPLAVIVYREELDKWPPGAHTGTFRGNQLAMVAGRETLRYILDQDLPAHAAAMGRLLMERLTGLQTRHPFVGEVRGRGLMVGVEVIDPATTGPDGHAAYDGARARALQQACFERGVIVETGGRHGAVLRFLPPLVVTQHDVEQIAGIVGEACAATAGVATATHV